MRLWLYPNAAALPAAAAAESGLISWHSISLNASHEFFKLEIMKPICVTVSGFDHIIKAVGHTLDEAEK